jgi:hypothetical protein
MRQDRRWTDVAACALLLRFFRIVPPVPRPVVLLCVAAVVTSVGLAVIVPARTRDTLPGLLVLQIFAASSGVLRPARRGYYDSLLSRGVGRIALLLGHWAASIVPGLLCLFSVAALEAMVTQAPQSRGALATGSLVAFWLASTLPWAITAPLPRFAAGMGWLVGLVTALATIPAGQTTVLAALRHPELVGWAPLAPVVYPMGLLGVDLTPQQWRMVWPGLALSLVLSVAAGIWFACADLPLETPQ